MSVDGDTAGAGDWGAAAPTEAEQRRRRMVDKVRRRAHRKLLRGKLAAFLLLVALYIVGIWIVYSAISTSSRYAVLSTRGTVVQGEMVGCNSVGKGSLYCDFAYSFNGVARVLHVENLTGAESEAATGGGNTAALLVDPQHPDVAALQYQVTHYDSRDPFHWIAGVVMLVIAVSITAWTVTDKVRRRRARAGEDDADVVEA